MITQEWIEYGSVFALRYFFEKAGEGLPMHGHPAETEHNIVVLRGAVGLREDGPNAITFQFLAGQVIDPLLPHEIEALEDNTVTLHLFKHGKPASYEQVPKSEHRVTYESKL